jgi:hypothetical protein
MNVNTLVFMADYEARILGGPTGGTLYHFEWTRAQPEVGGLVLDLPTCSLLVEVIPSYGGEPWQGRFVQGPGGVTGLWATPSPTTLCVVASGQGYWVPVLVPQGFSEVRCNPVKKVFAVPGRSIIVFASYTELAGYGPTGLLWVTQRLSWDGLTITDVTEHHIRGLAWDSPADSEVPFVVDVDTGEHQGGSSPEQYMM